MNKNIIQLLVVVYKNYDIFDLWLNHHLNYLNGLFKIIVCDNTPPAFYQPSRWVAHPKVGYHRLELSDNVSDGESCGLAKSYLNNIATSEIVGHVDSDVFFLDRNFLEIVESYINNGGAAIGYESFYKDSINIYNTHFPNRRCDMAPGALCIFLRRDLAKKFTFVTTRYEGEVEHKEQMWRLREYLIDNKLPTHTINGFYKNDIKDKHYDQGMVFHGSLDNIQGIHLVKGSFGRQIDYNHIQEVLNKYKNYEEN